MSSTPDRSPLVLVPGWVALGLIAAMASLPFLHPHHRNPIPTFFPEWWAALFALLAAGVLFWRRYRERFALPKAALIPGALAGLILLQLALVPATRADTSLLAVLYLLWAILLMGVCSSLIDRHSAQQLGRALAIGIAFGALASALVLALQGTGGLRGSGLVSVLIGNRLFANLNQSNHLALQLWLGVAALIHLAGQRSVRIPVALPAIACLVVASLFTGSRAITLYALALPVLAFAQHRLPGAARRMLPLAAAALLMTWVANLVLPALELSSFETVGRRDWSGKGSDGLRSGLWWLAVQMGGEHWLTGIGWGRFASHTFEQIIRLRDVAPADLHLVPAEHAHNIGLHLFAELGVVAPLLLGALAVAWIVRVRRAAHRQWSGELAFACALLLLLALHAQLEYTLWYSFFLGIAAVALALADPQRFALPRPRATVTAVVLLAALATLLMLRHDYERLEDTMQWPMTVDGKPPRPWLEVSADLVELRQRSRFGAYVDLALAGTMSVDRNGIAHKLVICDKAIAFSPTDYTVFSCAALLALNAQPEAALDRLRRALLAYPEKAPGFVRFGSALKKDFPELEPLLRETERFATKNAPAG